MPTENFIDKEMRDVEIDRALIASGTFEPDTKFGLQDENLNYTLDAIYERIRKFNENVEEDLDLDKADVYRMITSKDDEEVNEYLKKLKEMGQNENDEYAYRSEGQKIFAAIKITNDAYKLNHPEDLNFREKIKLNGRLFPGKKLTDQEINHLADLIIQIQKDCGIYHCTDPKAVEEYRRHQINRLNKMNENGCQQLLRNGIKDLENEKTRAIVLKDLRYAGFDSMKNYTDQLEEKYAAEHAETAKAEIDKQKQEQKIFSRPTIEQVKEYATQKGHPEFDAKRYVEYNEEHGWKDKSGREFYRWQSNVDVWIANQEKREAEQMAKATQTAEEKQKIDEKAFDKTEKEEYEKPEKDVVMAFIKANALVNISEAFVDKLIENGWKDSQGEDIKNWQGLLIGQNKKAEQKKVEFTGYTKEQFDKIVKGNNLTGITDKDFEELSAKKWQTKNGENITDLPKYLKIRNDNILKNQVQAQSAGPKLH